MKKDIIDFIYNISLPFFVNNNLKLKKNSQGGVVFTLKTKEFELFGGYGFSSYINSISYVRSLGFNIKISEIEMIYSNIVANYNLNFFKNQPTVLFTDLEWQKKIVENPDLYPDTISINDYNFIKDLTFEVLNRIENIMFPLIENYLSLPFWASFYEENKERIYLRGPGEFYSNINDDYSIKHLIILKLCGSPSFEEAYNIHYERVKGFWEKFPEDEGTNSQMAMIKNLKDILDATPAKYDYRDLTPPYRFVKSEVARSSIAENKRNILVNDRKVEVEINGFEISAVQKNNIDIFLKDISKHFENVKSEIVNNAEFENEQGKLQCFEDSSGVLHAIAEALNIPFVEGHEKLSADYLYLKNISIDAEQNEASLTIGSDYNETNLTALLSLSGKVEIVHS
jgi:hypothetical protein